MMNLSISLLTLKAHRTWEQMIQRCHNPRRHSYSKYGGRGIKVCERWRTYANFLEDMGCPPTAQHSIDRFPNNDGDYEPGNCRWATAMQQARNRRSSLMLTAFNETKPAAAWAEDHRCLVSKCTLYCRVDRGWTHEDAITLPPNPPISGPIEKGIRAGKMYGLPERAEITVTRLQ